MTFLDSGGSDGYSAGGGLGRGFGSMPNSDDSSYTPSTPVTPMQAPTAPPMAPNGAPATPPTTPNQPTSQNPSFGMSSFGGNLFGFAAPPSQQTQNGQMPNGMSTDALDARIIGQLAAKNNSGGLLGGLGGNVKAQIQWAMMPDAQKQLLRTQTYQQMMQQTGQVAKDQSEVVQAQQATLTANANLAARQGALSDQGVNAVPGQYETDSAQTLASRNHAASGNPFAAAWLTSQKDGMDAGTQAGFVGNYSNAR